MERELDWHFGQTIAHTSGLQVMQSEPKNAISGRKSTVTGLQTLLQPTEAERMQLNGRIL
jgi:hypothetical protein